MGYYTRFDMTIETGKHTVAEIMTEIAANDDVFYGIDRPTSEDLVNQNTNASCYLGVYDECKWYDEESDMIEFSQRFPDATFIVEGHGEEEGDIWRHRYKNGVMWSQHIEMYWSEWH